MPLIDSTTARGFDIDRDKNFRLNAIASPLSRRREGIMLTVRDEASDEVSGKLCHDEEVVDN